MNNIDWQDEEIEEIEEEIDEEDADKMSVGGQVSNDILAIFSCW